MLFIGTLDTVAPRLAGANASRDDVDVPRALRIDVAAADVDVDCT
jgi:hypothetical protein